MSRATYWEQIPVTLEEDAAFVERVESEQRQRGRLVREEVRVTDPNTGGQKGVKPERMDLIPPECLRALGRVYGFGAEKYEDFNYLKGYSWRLSVGAMQRHITAWQMGETLDPESGQPHLAHAAWHCFTLMMFETHGLGTDDRIVTHLAASISDPAMVAE
jgi:hypothetical protein